MSDISIEGILSLLTKDSSVKQELLKLTKPTNDEKSISSHDDNNPTENTDRLQLKINLIRALVPLLSEKATEQAEFLIKLLSVISIIKQIQSTNN